MRDHEFKNAVGKIEDEIDVLLGRVQKAHESAVQSDASGHAEFYENVGERLSDAKNVLVSAYTMLLNGDDDLGVPPLDDE
jgi:hypothetical protein